MPKFETRCATLLPAVVFFLGKFCARNFPPGEVYFGKYLASLNRSEPDITPLHPAVWNNSRLASPPSLPGTAVLMIQEEFMAQNVTMYSVFARNATMLFCCSLLSHYIEYFSPKCRS